jgi:hypothetical protein
MKFHMILRINYNTSQHINRYVFVIQMQYVLYEVKTDLTPQIHIHSF